MSALEGDELQLEIVPEEDVPGSGMTPDEALALMISPLSGETDNVPEALLAAGDEVAEDDIITDEESGATWEGTLIVEGVESGDGRMFSPGSLTWPDPGQVTLPLMWQEQTGEGHAQSVTAGRITEIWRDGTRIRGRGTFDVNGENGREAYRLVDEKFLTGVSGDVDSVKDADIEMVFPDAPKEGEDPADISKLFAGPELTIFHKGRLRGATLVQFPAYVEANIQLTHGMQEMAVTGTGVGYSVESEDFAAVGSHKTTTSDGAWDGPANEKQLPSPMPVAKARGAYAWIDSSAVKNDTLTKAGGRFIHHEVGAGGTIGAANLTACSSGIGILHGGRGGTTIPSADRRGVYNHLAAHLRAAGQTPPPFEEATVDDVLIACADYPTPPREWFTDPELKGPTQLTVTDDGRVFGHAALWGSCHTGFANTCRQPPREGEHSYFHLGEVKTQDGEYVGVGQITLGTGHAPLFGIDAQTAASHYDNTGSAVADVTSGEDQHGIWVAGAIRNGTPVARIRELRAAKLSGDWRRIGGKLRLVAMLAVNAPGFPVPRTRTFVTEERQESLVAAGILMDEDVPDGNREALQKMAARLQREAGRDPASRAAALRAEILGGN